MVNFNAFDFCFDLKVYLLFYALVKIEFLAILSEGAFFKIVIVLHIFELENHLMRKDSGLFNLSSEIQSVAVLFIHILECLKVLRMFNMLAISYDRWKWDYHFLLQSSIQEFNQHLFCFNLLVKDPKCNIFEECYRGYLIIENHFLVDNLYQKSILVLYLFSMNLVWDFVCESQVAIIRKRVVLTILRFAKHSVYLPVL